MAVIGNLAVAITATTAGLQSGLSKSSKMVGGFGSTIAKAAGLAGLLAPPLALAAGVMKTITAGSTFEKEMSSLGALSGASANDLSALEAAALKLGPAAGGASLIVTGMQELSKAGQSAGDILNSIEGNARLAAAGEITLSQSAAITAAAINQFGLAASNTNEIVDQLSYVANASATDVGLLGTQLQYAAPLSHAAGKGLSETLAVLGKLSDQIGSDSAGTAFRAMMADMLNPSVDARKKLNELGISFTDTSGAMKPMSQIVNDLNSSMASMTGAQKLTNLTKIFDIRAASGMVALMGTGGDALAAFQSQIEGSAGYAESQAKSRLNNVAGAWTMLQGTIEVVAIKIWQPLQTGTANAINWLSSGIMALSPIFTQLGSIVGAAFTMIAQVAATTVAFWQAVVGPGFGLSLQSIVEGLMLVEYSFRNWQTLVNLAVTSALLQVVTFSNSIVYFFGTVVPGIVKWSVDNFGNLWHTVLDAVLTGFINFGQNIRTNMGAIWEFIKSGGMNDLKLTPWTPLLDGFRSSLSQMPEIAGREMGALEKSLDAQVKTLGSNFGEGFAAFRDAKMADAAKGLPGIEQALATPKMPDMTAAIGPTLDMKPSSRVIQGNQFGSKEAEKSILNAIYGPQKTDAKEQLKVGKEQLSEQKKLNTTMKVVAENLEQPEVVSID